ncbi:MAG: glycosyltransferase family 39 protein [Planctomycetota bacterium]
MTQTMTEEQRTKSVDAALALVLAVTVVRAVYVLFLSPYALVEDEAHYWEWALRLDWSYYSKGPGVAWSIWLATSLLGHAEGVIRLPAVIASGILALTIARMTARIHHDQPWKHHAAFVAAALVFLTPAYQLPAILMTIDGPYIACWALASYFALLSFLPLPHGERVAERSEAGRGEDKQSPKQGKSATLLLFALFLGAGFLYKYTILLILPGLAAFLILNRKRITLPSIPATTAAALLALASVAPVIIWNAQNDWVTVKHLAGHLGLAWGDQPRTPEELSGWSYDPNWTLELIGTQLGIAGLTITLAILGIRHARKNRLESAHASESLMLWLALPILAFYLLVTLVTDAETNWPIAGYLTLIPLAARLIAERAGKASARLWKANVILGVLAGIVLARLDLAAAGARAIGIKGDHAGRLLSGPGMGEDFAVLSSQLASQTGQEPFIVAAHYARASILAYYLSDRPTIVYSASPYAGGRKSQQDFWQDTSLAKPELLGRPAIMLGGLPEHWQPAFERIERIENVPSDHKGDRRTLFIGYGYRGFPELRPEDK